MVEVDFIRSELIYLFKARKFDKGMLTLRTAKFITMLLINMGGYQEHVMIYVLIYLCTYVWYMNDIILRSRLCMI